MLVSETLSRTEVDPSAFSGPEEYVDAFKWLWIDLTLAFPPKSGDLTCIL